MYGFGNDVKFMDQQPMAMASQGSPINIPLTGAMNPAMFNQPMQTASMNVPQTGVINPTGLRNFNPSSNRNPFMAASVNPRAPMNPFNPGFAAQRSVVMPTQPRPGMPPQPPRPPVTNPFQPSFNSPMGFRGPVAQQRVMSGLSQLPRKPMFRRFAEGGNI
jgi:hypothetical protein